MSFLRGNLRAIEAFATVMECGTALRAAELLYTTQPTISKLISALEKELEVPLFERFGGRLKPTDYAFRLLREAQQMEAEISEFERRVREIKDDAQESIWFEAVSALAVGLVPRAIARFKAIYPHIKINFTVAHQDQILSNTKKSVIDFGLIHLAGDEPHPDSKVFRTCKLVCIAPKGHPLTKKDSVTPADLAKYPLVSYRASLPYSRLIESAFEEHGIEYKGDITVNHSVALYSTVNAGYGAAVVDSFFPLDDVFPNVIRRPFFPEREVSVGFVVAEARPLPAAAQKFLELMSDEAV